MSQGGGKKSKADIAREYMIAHAQQVAAVAWQCGRCGTANDSGADFCVQCGADGQGGNRIPVAAQQDTQPVLIVTMNEVPGYRITEVHGDVFGMVVRAGAKRAPGAPMPSWRCASIATRSAELCRRSSHTGRRSQSSQAQHLSPRQTLPDDSKGHGDPPARRCSTSTQSRHAALTGLRSKAACRLASLNPVDESTGRFCHISSYGRYPGNPAGRGFRECERNNTAASARIGVRT
jgi:hypothetical protein